MKYIKENLFILSLLCLSTSLWAQSPNCSSYLTETTDGPGACANQPYLLQVPLDVCPGTVSFCIDVTSDVFASELSIDLLDGSGAVVSNLLAAGTVADGGQPGEICTGDLDAAQGPYAFSIGDTFGDGNTGTVLITDVNSGMQLYNTTMTGLGPGEIANYDLAPGLIDPITTVTVNWYENGAIIQTDAAVACNTFFYQYTLTSSSICQTEDQTIGYEIICDEDGVTLASNLSIPVTVYPPVAPAITDLVDISYPADPAGGCAAAVITYLNDCTETEVQVVENAGPTACAAGDTNVAGDGDFTVTYVGPTGAPDCCATGGPQVPLQDSGSNLDGLVTDLGGQDQFGGVANANGFSYSTSIAGCGLVTAGTLTFNVCNIVHPNADIPDPPPTGQDPTAAGEHNYFVTIYVNGGIVFDGDLDTGGNFGDWTLCGDNTLDLAALGFDGNSTVEVYVYSNQLGGTTYGTSWDADITVSIDATYDLCTVAAPVDCALPLLVPYDCACAPAPVCTLTDAGYIVGACDDSGTDMDPADDTFTFDLNPTGTDLGASGYTFTDGANYTGSGTYGASATFGPFMIADGTQTITITDADNPGCTIDVVVTPPATCSDAMPPMCTLSGAGLSAGTCDNAGTTAEDNSADGDDTFVLTINPVGMNTGTTYTISGDATGTGSYGTAFTVTLPADGSAISITITDDTDTACTITEGIMAPAACSMEAINDIPTVGEWGLIILTLLLSITAIVGIRQRSVEEMTT